MNGGGEVRVLRAADRPATVWKNGGGVTREIAAWPADADMDSFRWRVSLAGVAADGPFSAFPGIDRTLTLVEGAGMDLAVAGVHRLVDERFTPQDFAGDEPTDCRLIAGPVVNFNVMCRRGAATAETAVVRGRLTVTAAPDETLLVVALDGPATFEAARGPAHTLGPYDAALARGACTGRVRTAGRAAVVRLRRDPARPGDGR
ncbi:HutD family protein [Streptomyces sp. NRRL F-2664]|uniref:HutD/Ves family protein n=1 Tax=Streptomyces sp. NRRL F-2664 TaxID=1463842 RepID=UPI00069025AE|nr:HutD family protein [Streptomyces sp. NRRL F-2664]